MKLFWPNGQAGFSWAGIRNKETGQKKEKKAHVAAEKARGSGGEIHRLTEMY